MAAAPYASGEPRLHPFRKLVRTAMPAPIDANHARHSPYKSKIVSSAEAVMLIHDGDTVATGGFVGIGFALSLIHI